MLFREKAMLQMCFLYKAIITLLKSCFDKLDQEFSVCWSISTKNHIISLRKMKFYDRYPTRSRAANPPPRSGCFVVLRISTLRTINLVCTFSCSFSFLIHWARCTLQTVLFDCVLCVSQGSWLYGVVSKVIQRLQHYLVRSAALVTWCTSCSTT